MHPNSPRDDGTLTPDRIVPSEKTWRQRIFENLFAYR